MGKGQYIRRKKLTMEDIAREAGCSKAAVSYVINQNHPISPELKRKVNAIIEKRRYTPSARSKYVERRQIAILTMDIPGWHYTDWNDEIRKRGYLPCCYHLLEDTSVCLEKLGQINRNRNIAGIICLHPEIQSVDLLRLCKNLPSVIFCRMDSMLSFASVPYREFGVKAAGEFLRYGHKRAAVIYHRSNTPRQNALVDGFVDELGSQNIRRIALLKSKTSEQELSFEMLDEAYAEGYRAFFILSMHPLTLSLLRWAYSRKYFIPEDISLFAMDHNQQGRLMVPPISNIGYNFEKLIPLTVEHLISRIEGHDPPAIICEPCISDLGSIAMFR